jgi:hypothetical protein
MQIATESTEVTEKIQNARPIRFMGFSSSVFSVLSVAKNFAVAVDLGYR